MTRQAIAIVLALGLVLLGWGSMFTVSEKELAIKFRLGKIVKSDYAPGLHFKLPFINNVRLFDKRILPLDAAPAEFLTSEKKGVIVDSFVKWRIHDVERFYTSNRGDERQAVQRLNEIMESSLRDKFGDRTLVEVVSTERNVIMEEVRKETNRAAENLGVEIVDVRIKRIDLPPNVSSSVFERMRAERGRIASLLRSQGNEAAERIRAEADRQSTVIMAEAYRDAQNTRGEGDAKAADTYAAAYGKDPDFYTFYRSLQAYRSAFNGRGDVFVLKPEGEFFEQLGTGGK